MSVSPVLLPNQSDLAPLLARLSYLDNLIDSSLSFLSFRQESPRRPIDHGSLDCLEATGPPEAL